MDIAFPFLFVIIVVGFVIAMIVWSINQQKKVRENWMKFAQKHGLKIQGGAGIGSRPTVQGWLDGVHIQLNTVVRGSGKNRSTYTQHHATVNAPMPAGLVLTKEGLFSKVGKMFGGEDVQIGDRAIDDAFIIKAQDLIGTHDLLSNQYVKKALLYCIARYPGMKIENRHILVESSGMTAKLERIEGVFQDVAYLVKTLDAAYQELASAHGAPAPTTAQAQIQSRREMAQATRTEDHARRDAAQAEILDMGYMRSDEAKAREVSQEDLAAKNAALSEMANSFNALSEKMAQGDITDAAHAGEDSGIGASEALSDYDPNKSLPGDKDSTSWMGELSGKESDAFADPNVGENPFDDPGLFQDDVDPAQVGNVSKLDYEATGLDDYNPTHSLEDAPASADEVDVSSMSFESEAANKAFENPDFLGEDSDAKEEVADGKAEEKPAGETLGSFEAIVEKLSDSSLMSSQRKSIIESHGGKSWEIKFVVDRVDSSFGFDLPDHLRDGKTVEGHFENGAKVSMRFARDKNDEIRGTKRGETMKAWGKLVDWDDLFKKATLNAE